MPSTQTAMEVVISAQQLICSMVVGWVKKGFLTLLQEDNIRPNLKNAVNSESISSLRLLVCLARPAIFVLPIRPVHPMLPVVMCVRPR
mmetsp:Transcript_25004/g.58053  ORF Transcript_25004/g.58053 Transcript_25004/m.58053 type:complete len:88 (+) Transcript_25004:888-1151(+)